jgi:hypothetical protein
MFRRVDTVLTFDGTGLEHGGGRHRLEGLKPMTAKQQAFVELEKQRDKFKRYLEELAQATRAVADEIGIGGYFQDDEGVVYKIVAPAGKWVQFESLSYVRTKRVGEDKGSLSVKEAKEAGFAPGMT